MAEDKAKQREEEERKFAQEDHYKELLRDQRSNTRIHFWRIVRGH